ncbi:MAG TPA: M48 family metalloprotease [Thermoanaerobaculia bacterium]|jgi:predicted Zn-dependent protease|nr:M48 family metalloprotease [Thermoanaerobaculia bacterium]
MSPLDRRFLGGSRRLLVAVAMAMVAIAGYYGSHSYNPIAEVLPLRITPQQEVAIGLQAAPAMAQRYGGLSSDQQAQRHVDRICHDLVEKTDVKSTPYEFDCHLLADERTAGAFALPGGQVFLTSGLLARLRTDGELAGVLGHELGHVVARHGAEHLAGVRNAALARYDPNDPASRRNPAVAALVGQLTHQRFSRKDEIEADRIGVRLMSEAGYDPRGAARVRQILRAGCGAEKSGGSGEPPL